VNWESEASTWGRLKLADTTDSELSAFLRYPLYALTTETESIAGGGLNEGQRDYWRTRHELGQLRSILEALEWAVKHPDYPFGNLLPGLNFSQESLYNYLCQIKGDFEEIVDALSDSNPAKSTEG
jgi:hypothetical protein